MTKEEFIKRFCYYLAPHGFYRPGEDPHNFGTLESYYINGVEEDERPKWENEDVPMCIQAFPVLAPLLKNSKFSKETKGMLAYMAVMQDYNAPGTDMRFFLDYGKGIDQKALLPIPPSQGEPFALDTEEVQKAIREAQAKGNPHLYQYCGFFKGEKECPYEANTDLALYWDLERSWVLVAHSNIEMMSQYEYELAIDYGSKLDYLQINDELIAVMYNQYTHFHQSGNGFEDWAVEYVRTRDLHGSVDRP